MSIYAIMIDSQHAKVFTFIGGEVTHHAYHRHEPEHHTGHSVEAAQNSEHFFSQVASHLTGASKLLLMGPGLGKDHFKSHLEKHHAGDLAQKIVAVDTVDHPTDPQLVAHAREVFAAHHVAL